MKICIISPNPSHLQAMRQVLEAQPQAQQQAHQLVLVEGGKSKMRALAEQEQPALMLVDGMCCEPGELNQVEHVTTQHPQTAVILLCATQTPEFLLQAMRVGVKEVLPSPASAAALLAAVARVEARRKGVQPRSAGKLLAFLPCKGGSGATFLATNLGAQLAQTQTVLLIDLNLQFGDALTFVHEGEAPSTLADVARDISRLDASFLAASSVKIGPNYSLLAAPADPTQAMEIKPEQVDAVLTVALANYDFVLPDMGRTLDTLAIKVLDRAHRIFPVLQATLPALRHAKQLLGVFRSLGYAPDKFEWLVNRFEKGGEIGLADIQQSLGVSSLRTVPNAYREVNAAINQGNPLLQTSRASSVIKTLAELAVSLNPAVEDHRSVLGRWFRRA